MTNGPQINRLPDGKRLHLHHGPIDLIIGAEGPDRNSTFSVAIQRFETILTGLVGELAELRRPIKTDAVFVDATARRMRAAVLPYHDHFVTPMAAVAGAVADEILETMTREHNLDKAYVNNGGDIAFHLGKGRTFKALGLATSLDIPAGSPVRGIATSGWRGRSHSLGIADAVTVTARNAAMADVAATLIANAVDLPGNSVISRTLATDLNPDSDLQGLWVTTGVGPLTDAETHQALKTGLDRAHTFLARGLIHTAMLTLNGHTLTTEGALAHA